VANAHTDSTTSGNCTTSTITNWASQISAYIKSIDPNHLVAIGDEGFFNEPTSPVYIYQCVFISAQYGVCA
jgi:mannan endo-1,4-beta-mannosidase